MPKYPEKPKKNRNITMKNVRSSGILLHITSLPSPFGIGDLGPSAFDFADLLAHAKQRFWQILPITPPAITVPHSPYNPLSAFAGDPLLISPHFLQKTGLLARSDISKTPLFTTDNVDFARVIPYKRRLLNIAFKNFASSPPPPEYTAFCDRNRNWLDDFALFVTIRDLYKTADWHAWPAPIRDRDKDALDRFAGRHRTTIERHRFAQYIFFEQFLALKHHCTRLGIRLIGDMPFYVSYQSADVWANPSFFKLNRHARPAFVSGTPPDCFCSTGQLWGNPVYDWPQLRKHRYSWWLDRFAHNLEMFDTLRIDHFRAFVASWQVPAANRTAAAGRWIRAPKDDFFKKLLARFPASRFIAEDLGHITPPVRRFVDQHNITSTKVLQFGLSDDNPRNSHNPANHPANSTVYTGTHDNNTLIGWFQNELPPDRRAALKAQLDASAPDTPANWQFIDLAMQSRAKLAIIPMQDILALDQSARMNTPGTFSTDNWTWRMTPDQPDPSAISRLALATTRSHRTVNRHEL
jgi:4-alpha-glucanotransferase